MENAEREVPAWKSGMWGVGLVLLLIFGALAAVLWMGLSAMATDVCTSGIPGPPICSPGMQRLVMTMPLAGLAAGLLVGLVGGRLALRWHRSPLVWLVAAWALGLTGFIVSNEIASAAMR